MGAIVVLLLAAFGCRSEEDNQSFDSTTNPVEAYDPLEFVDPFIATGGKGAEIASVSPGATMPFGMVYVGPDTRSSYGAPGFYHCAGYHWEDTHISAFSHTHAQGMGVTDYGTVAVMPQSGWRDEYVSDEGRQLPFDHENEWATPSFYGVDLGEINVSIVATLRGALHEYEYASGEPTLLFDLAHALGTDEVHASELNFDVQSGVITGYQNLHGSYSERFGGLRTWFYAEVDPLPVSWGVWENADTITEGGTQVDGDAVGGWLGFPSDSERVTLRLAVSYVDLDGARANFEEELRGKTRGDLKQLGESAWRDELSHVRVRGGDEAQRRIFHSALYRAQIMPSQFNDVDGRYRGLDGEVRVADFPYYTDFSLWDTFRTSHPWFSLTNRIRQRDMLRSLVQMHRDGGAVPRWPLAHGYTGGMIGTPADQVFAEGWLKGIDGWDVDYAFDASFEHARMPVAPAGRSGIESYLNVGYVSADETSRSVSKTLEYAWSDFALSEWASGMGRDEAAVLAEQAGSWQNVWDASQRFFAARRDDGSFIELSGEFIWDDAFVEGNAWHYRWGVPFDVDGLITVQNGGDRGAFLSELEAYWDEVYAEENDLLPDDWYWHGNEPDLHYAYLASLAGDWAGSAEPIQWLRSNRYADDPVGLDGNDDGGTLSSWYLFAAIGLYPVAGTDKYAVGTPIFDRVELDVGEQQVVIRRHAGSPDSYTPVALFRDGEAFEATVIRHDELVGSDWLFELE